MCPPSIQPDFSEAIADLAAGDYAVRVAGSEVKTGQKNGTPYVRWTLETFGKDDQTLNDRKIYHNTMLTGKGTGMLKQFLKALGYDPEVLPKDWETEDAHGKEMIVVVKPGEGGFPEVKSVKAFKADAAA